MPAVETAGRIEFMQELDIEELFVFIKGYYF